MTTLAVEVGVDTLRAGRSIHVRVRSARTIERALAHEATWLASEDSIKPGWVVLRLRQPRAAHLGGSPDDD